MIPTQQHSPFLPRDPRQLRMAAYRAVSQGVADTDWRGWGRHSVRRAVAENFVQLVTPILNELQRQQLAANSTNETFRVALANANELRERAEKRSGNLDHWRGRHAGAVAEARRQAYRSRLLEDALRDVLRTFPQLDPGMPTWDQWSATSHKVQRRQLAEWGQLIPTSRRARDWRRHSVLRTRRDATNKQLAEANRRAYSAEEGERGAEQAHRQELKARSEAEIGWREATAEVKRLKAERTDAPQRIAQLETQLDRQMTAHGERVRQHQETHRRYTSTIRQAQREHQRADKLAALVQQLHDQLADAQLAAKEQQRAAARRTCGASIGNPLNASRLIGPCIRPADHTDPEHQASDGVKWTLLVPQMSPQPPSRFAAVTCWCGHMEQSHVTDGADNAVCRVCVREQTTLHQAFHVHAPEQP